MASSARKSPAAGLSTVVRQFSHSRIARLVQRARIAFSLVGFDAQSPTLLQVGRLMRARNYNLAAAQLEQLKTMKERSWRALLLCYYAAHRFEDAVAVYERMPASCQRDYSCRFYYVMAAANLERLSLITPVIIDVLNEPSNEAASRLLCKVYPLIERLVPERSAEALTRILSDAERLAGDSFDDILRCAHHLSEKGHAAEAGRLEQALRQSASTSGRLVKLDLYAAQGHFRDRQYGLQLACVNAALARRSVSPVALKDESRPLSCDNLRAASDPVAAARGPLVSVIVPAYNCSDTIGYVLESLQAQTYQDIEVLVVDDASTDGTAQIVHRFSAVDPRIRLLSLEANSGPFIARNRALSVAAGEYVTNQDSDDWAHPQKIALAAAELQKDPSIVATWVEHVRCSSSKGFRILNGYVRPDASSLMFRRQTVMEKIGWYDSVRAAGDGEFHLRMERAFGPQSIRQLGKLLSFVSWSDNTLSGGGAFRIDNSIEISSPVRNQYRRAFGVWHETASELSMPFPINERPFAIPVGLLPHGDFNKNSDARA